MARTQSDLDTKREAMAVEISEQERKMIVASLERCAGCVADVSRDLRMPLRTVWHRLTALDIDPDEYRDGPTRGRRIMVPCVHCGGEGCAACDSTGSVPESVAAIELDRDPPR